ncbi:hypothetical protein ACFWNT_41785 [Streptomyces sp. NPDC058409]|uniref:DUF7660 family protein n=1 Tax=Streptomyces sp. NPDC058409 TaxID=3346484 RepID=UPI003661F5DE
MILSLHQRAAEVRSREDFAPFLREILEDLKEHPNEWENRTLADFLEAWAAWVHDMPGWYANRGQGIPDQPDWNLLAGMVMAARVYE